MENGCFTEADYDKTYRTGSKPGILYGSTKVRKPAIENRPPSQYIFFAINTPRYKLAQFLVLILFQLCSYHLLLTTSFQFRIHFGLQKDLLI